MLLPHAFYPFSKRHQLLFMRQTASIDPKYAPQFASVDGFALELAFHGNCNTPPPCETVVSANPDSSISILGTRDAAAPLRHEVEQALEEQKTNICIDFASVMATQSFVDEFLGALILRYGPSVLARLTFKACSEDVKAVIRFVASSRAHDYRKIAENPR